MTIRDSFRRPAAVLSCLVILASHSLAGMPLAFGQQAAQVAPLEYAPGELLIKVRPNVPPAIMQQVYARLQATPLEQISADGWFRIRLNSPAIMNALAYARQLPELAGAEPNYRVTEVAIPNDPSFKDLWGLHNTGQTSGIAGNDIDAPEAWDRFRPAGNSLTIAVLDSGIDFSHPDLSGRIWTNPREVVGNGVDDDGNGYIDDIRGWNFVANTNNPSDDRGHGTHVSGTLVAAFNNSTGVAGVVGPAGIRVMPLKFLDNNGSGYTSNAVKALDYATNNGAFLSNNSWGGTSFSQALYDAINRNNQRGGLVVAAAGNNNTNTDSTPYYPQGYDLPNVMSVASINAADALSSFSNFGGSSVDLAAPGEKILSTVPGGGYALYSGTSMATPHVAGAAALMWAQNPGLTNAQVKKILMDTTRKVGYLSGKTVTGGTLNLNNALAAAGYPSTPAPAPSPSPSPAPAPAPAPTPAPTPSPTPAPTVPAAPSNLSGTPRLVQDRWLAYRYVQLNWVDNATNETTYEVWRSTSPTTGFTMVKSLGVNVTSWTDSLGSGMFRDYYYRVRATNASGASAFSNTIQIVRF